MMWMSGMLGAGAIGAFVRRTVVHRAEHAGIRPTIRRH